MLTSTDTWKNGASVSGGAGCRDSGGKTQGRGKVGRKTWIHLVGVFKQEAVWTQERLGGGWVEHTGLPVSRVEVLYLTLKSVEATPGFQMGREVGSDIIT